MGEHEIQASLDLYNVQLEQVVLALAVTTEESARADLTKLQSDLTELIVLTEESLLNAKKAKLLSMLDDSTTSSHESEGRRTSVPSQGDAMDAEFAAFQAAIGGETSSVDVYGPETSSLSRQTVTAQMGDESATSSTAGAEDDVDFSEIVGTKCRVWFNQDWGQSGWHNCMVLSAEPLHPDKPPAVRVLFCNPVHRRMLPCPFFMEDRCRFSDEECRFSHGHKVLVEDLEEFEDPDYSALCMECRCLARYEEDDLWYKAIVVDVLADHKYTVMYDSYEDTATLDVEDLLPLPDSEGSSSGSDSEGGEMAGMEDEDEAMPVYLWRPPKTTDALGEWEKHTKGIGSKLMAKMGYISGQGLGKNSEGRAEPVPIQLLPQGKSLDKIMELKEKAGDQDLYDVMKKHKRKHKKTEAKAAKGYNIKNESHSVFDFLNNRLGKKKGNVKDLVKHSHATKAQKTHISEKDLNEKSDRHLNIQIFQTHEELKNVDKELSKLQESLKRNNSGSTTTMKIKQKISSLESYRNQLKHSEHSIQKHRTKRNDKKKMTVF